MENLSNELISWPEIDDVATPLSSFCLIDPDTELLKLNKLNSFEKTLNLNSSTEEEKESQSPMHNKESENLPSKKVRFISNQESKQHPVFISKKTKNKEGNIEIIISNFPNGRWKKEEREKFAYALYKFGPNWKKINVFISTRNRNQIGSHAQKFLKRLKKSSYLIKEKNLNFTGLNWNNSYNLLKENLTDEELLSVLLSIDSEIEDNKRWSEKKENSQFMLRKISNLEKMNNNSNTSNIKENRIDIQNIFCSNKLIEFPNLTNSINNSINLDENYNNDYFFLNYENDLKENILCGNDLENLNLSFEDTNNRFNFEI